MRINRNSYDFVPTRLAFSLKSVFADNQAARELVCGIGSMQRRRMTLHDSLRICDACKTDMELQAKAKMILFASKLDWPFVNIGIIGWSFQSCINRVANRTNQYWLVVSR